MATLLAIKASNETPIAKDDDHHGQMANDPTVPQFSQDSSFGQGFATSATPAGFGTIPTQGVNTMPTQSTSVIAASPAGSTAAGTNAAQDAEVLVANDNSDWINKKWRPAMGWVYMMTCTMDFVVFPILWSLLQALSHGQVTSQWQPLTLQGAGLYHIAMGAVLGIAAYGRTKEKVSGNS